MKKLSSLTAAAFATLAWVGCSQDGVINEAPSANQAIEFGTYLGRDAQGQTRATATDLDYVKTKGFGVFAYYTQQTSFADYNKKTTPNFMYNQQVTWPKADGGAPASNGAWTYDPVKYWPNNTHDKVSFIAYAPYDANFKPSSTDFYIPYTVLTDNSDTKLGVVKGGQGQDLLYAKVTDKTKQALNEKVKFEFKHTLARIGFSVQGAIDITGTTENLGNENNKLDDNTVITVNKVILSGKEHEYKNSTVTEPTSLKGANVFYKSAELNLVTGDWTGQKSEKLYFILTPEENFVDTNDDAEGTQFELKGAQKTATQLNKDDSYLMIIPQDFKSTTATDNLYVYIEYTVTTAAIKDGELDLNDPNKSVITNYISTKAPINFVAGKAYNINLILGLNSVDIEASDTGWGTDTKEDVKLPDNTPGTATEPTEPTEPTDPAPDISDPDVPASDTEA